VTDGYCVYHKFINDCDRIISKTYMTGVEGENTRRATLFSQTSSTNSLLF